MGHQGTTLCPLHVPFIWPHDLLAPPALEAKPPSLQARPCPSCAPCYLPTGYCQPSLCHSPLCTRGQGGSGQVRGCQRCLYLWACSLASGYFPNKYKSQQTHRDWGQASLELEDASASLTRPTGPLPCPAHLKWGPNLVPLTCLPQESEGTSVLRWGRKSCRWSQGRAGLPAVPGCASPVSDLEESANVSTSGRTHWSTRATSSTAERP